MRALILQKRTEHKFDFVFDGRRNRKLDARLAAFRKDQPSTSKVHRVSHLTLARAYSPP